MTDRPPPGQYHRGGGGAPWRLVQDGDTEESHEEKAMADQGSPAAMVGQGTQAAMTGQGTQATMADQGTQAAMAGQGSLWPWLLARPHWPWLYGPLPQIFLGKSKSGGALWRSGHLRKGPWRNGPRNSGHLRNGSWRSGHWSEDGR